MIIGKIQCKNKYKYSFKICFSLIKAILHNWQPLIKISAPKQVINVIFSHNHHRILIKSLFFSQDKFLWNISSHAFFVSIFCEFPQAPNVPWSKNIKMVKGAISILKVASALMRGIQPLKILKNGRHSGGWMPLISTLARNMFISTFFFPAIFFFCKYFKTQNISYLDHHHIYRFDVLEMSIFSKFFFDFLSSLSYCDVQCVGIHSPGNLEYWVIYILVL
jgi:hypothetical protein